MTYETRTRDDTPSGSPEVAVPERPRTRLPAGGAPSAARRLAPLLGALFPRGIPVRFAFWDGSAIGPEVGPGTVTVRSPRALTRVLWSPDELGVARAYVAGEVDLDGHLFTLLDVLRASARQRRALGPATVAGAAWAALRLGALALPPPPPAEEVRLVGRRHSKRRDAVQAVTHHYDVGNEFYRLVLGAAMTYSCARFEKEGSALEDAQRSKHDLVCRKLGLHERPAARLLDVGCGWGSMVLHAASEYGAHAVGITLSPAQAALARERARDAGLEDRVEIRLQDYRDLRGETFDAISSIGMFEHVGTRRMAEYFDTLHGFLSPQGRLLNHAISKPGGSKLEGRTFVNRYVFPDGELVDVAEVAKAMERAGFEVRDVESLREHYSETLHAWVQNLEASWDEAVALVGEARSRVWRLYMAGSANGFDRWGLAVHQVLGVVPTADGRSGMPRTRAAWG